jgi:hypothetical protein
MRSNLRAGNTDHCTSIGGVISEMPKPGGLDMDSGPRGDGVVCTLPVVHGAAGIEFIEGYHTLRSASTTWSLKKIIHCLYCDQFPSLLPVAEHLQMQLTSSTDK